MARAIGPTSTTVWPNAAPSVPSPRTLMMVGADVTVSAGTVITVAAVKEANARALTRLLGTYADPILGSPCSAFSALTSGDGVTSRIRAALGQRVGPVQAAQAAQRGEPPLLLAARRDREIRRVVRLVLMQPGDGRIGLERPLKKRHQPTAPSICSAISRFSSSAYSIGSSRAIGSTKPRTMVAAASSSVMPRLIR